MRVISGEFGGRKLNAPTGEHTRPTSDRVREALFAILGARVRDAQVLDIFAGSGAMALEAISRGALGAVVIDSDRASQSAIQRNIQALGVGESVRLLGLDFRQALSSLRGRTFSLAFADPPYAKLDYYEAVMRLLHEYRLLSIGALLVMEHVKGAKVMPLATFEISDSRRYGDTMLTILRYRGAEGLDERLRDPGQL